MVERTTPSPLRTPGQSSLSTLNFPSSSPAIQASNDGFALPDPPKPSGGSLVPDLWSKFPLETLPMFILILTILPLPETILGESKKATYKEAINYTLHNTPLAELMVNLIPFVSARTLSKLLFLKIALLT